MKKMKNEKSREKNWEDNTGEDRLFHGIKTSVQKHMCNEIRLHKCENKIEISIE